MVKIQGMRAVFSVALAIFLCSVCCFAQNQEILDKRDLVTREWITDVATNVRFLDHETIYNSDGLKIQETEFSKLGKIWTKKYQYDQNGRMLKELTYNDKGRLDNIRKFEYNGYGKKQTVYTYDAKGKLIKIKVIEYKLRDHDD